MTIVPHSTPFVSVHSPLMLPAPSARLALPAPKIAGLLPAGRVARRVHRLEVARTPENHARMAGSLGELLASMGRWVTMDDAYAVVAYHQEKLREGLARRRAEAEAETAALNAWWDAFLATTDMDARRAMLAERRAKAQARTAQTTPTGGPR